MKKHVGLLVPCLVLVGTSAGAEDYRGEAVPKTRRAHPVELWKLEFHALTYGHGGPMGMPLETPPVSGREYLVEADILGLGSAATIRFELLDGDGRALRTVTMWRDSDGASDEEFYGFVEVPNQPFRFAVTGTGVSGAPFRSVSSTLFQPLPTGSPVEPLLPPGLPPEQRSELLARIAEAEVEFQKEVQKRMARAAAEHPGGVIALARAVVSPIAYEPLTSARGLPIGLRLRYSIQFSTRQTIATMPDADPEHEISEWRSVRMKRFGGTIDPMPRLEGEQSIRDVIVYDSRATYEAGTKYHFTVDLIPDYVIQGKQSGRFCIHEQKFTDRSAWAGLMASESDVPYSISIPDTETAATIPKFYPQRTFHQSFLADGASDCGPNPNINF